MDSLKQKAVSGFFWSFIDSISKQGVTFIIGILLARLLSPREFGLIGMTTLFIAISQSMVDSGFSQALVRKLDCSQFDYSTVFYFNVLISIFIYLLLFCSAHAIGIFFHEPQLEMILKVLGLGIIINALGVIQNTLLIKRVDFRLQTKISALSALVSGCIGVAMAFYGFGVWSLVAKTLSGYAINTFFLWLWNHWRPILVFHMNAFKELFSFGSKLLISGLLYTAYKNIYLLVIGKYFSANELGLYTRADQFISLTSQNVNGMVQRVSYPVLSNLQDDKLKFKTSFRRILKSTMLITFLLSLGLAAIAEPLVFTLIGKKWLPCVVYLRLLCFVGMLFPLHSLNLNILNVYKRSDLFLRLEIIKIFLSIPVILLGIQYGVKTLIFLLILHSIIAIFINGFWSGKLIDYDAVQQLKDIFPSFLLALFLSVVSFMTGWLVDSSMFLKLLLQISIMSLLFFSLAEFFGIKDYMYLKEIIKGKMKLSLS